MKRAEVDPRLARAAELVGLDLEAVLVEGTYVELRDGCVTLHAVVLLSPEQASEALEAGA